MSREIPYSPSVFFSMFVGASLAAAWIAARPSDFIAAICLGTASCAMMLLFLVARRFDAAVVEDHRRALHERALMEAEREARKLAPTTN